jgi:hypothetical protein
MKVARLLDGSFGVFFLNFGYCDDFKEVVGVALMGRRGYILSISYFFTFAQIFSIRRMVKHAL